MRGLDTHGSIPIAYLENNFMTKKCEITDKSSTIAGGYSNRTRATKFNPTGKTRKQVNLQRKTIFVPEIDKHVTVNISTRALKQIQQKGPYKVLKEANLI